MLKNKTTNEVLFEMVLLIYYLKQPLKKYQLSENNDCNNMKRRCFI